MSNGQFGARDLQKHLWKLSIPKFDPEIPLHVSVSDVGEAVAGEAECLAKMRQERDRVTVTIGRRALRR